MRSAATSIVSWPVTLLDTTVVASCVSPMGVARLWLKSYCCASSNAIALAYWDCLLKNLLFLFSSIRFFSPLSPLSVIAIYVVACFFLFYYIRTFCFILPLRPSFCILFLYLILISLLLRLRFISRPSDLHFRLIYLQRSSWNHFLWSACLAIN